ncbi:MAG: LamG-like jellyroll fold domain-containing protein [Verrucomicrobiota bacterium]
MKGEDRPQWLLDGYCSGSLSDEEFAEFEGMLREDESLRRRLIGYRMLESDLRAHEETKVHLAARTEAGPVQLKTLRRLRAEVVAMAAVIAVLLIGLAVLGLRGISWPSSDVATEPIVDPGVAVLTREIDAQWENAEVRLGDSMPRGLWQLVSGTAELEFYSGASVILEAPATLEITSENHGILHAGRLRADVPHHAHGFTITTKSVELVDLGTAFGMEVGADERTSVHVFDGEVEIFEPNGERQQGEGEILLAGEGRVLSLSTEPRSIEADGSRFLTPTEIGEKARLHEQENFSRWLSHAGQWKEDSRLVAHYPFQEGGGRSLENQSSTEFNGLRGAIIGARWKSGRWPDKGALDFKRPSDRVRIEVPEKFESMTLVAWVRIDGLDNNFNSLLLSDGWDRPGAVHWQILKSGEIELAVWHGQKETHNSRAPFVLHPFDFGQWLQLAVVYDGASGTVSHYRDGKLSGVVTLPAVVPLSIGNAEIGNWTPPALKSRQIRQFNGQMDELLIFNAAFSDAEIQTLYQHGRP